MATLIDEKRDALSRGMESAASAIRDKVEIMPGSVGNAANATADAVEAAADYVRESNLSDMLADVRRFVREHPGMALLAVAAAGFLLARSVSRN